MFAISLLMLTFILCSFASAEQSRSSVIMCNSISCTWNKRCRCTRKEIAVYDNTVEGLCLYHSANMKDRVLEPMKKSRLLEQYEHETYIAVAMDKMKEKSKDEELLKNPAAFSKWMKRHGIGGGKC